MLILIIALLCLSRIATKDKPPSKFYTPASHFEKITGISRESRNLKNPTGSHGIP